MTPRIAVLLIGAAIVIGNPAHAARQQAAGQPQQVPGAIRSRVTLVPLDVRVLDRDGRPVTDLRREDFTVLEDGVPQKIGHFSFQQLEAEAPGPARPPLRKALDATVEEQRHRTFLIVMGRGRLHGWAGGYPAAITFVRDQLLPQDKVAVAAWNRATDFTTDHPRVATLLERLRDKHNGLELKLALAQSGLAARFGSKTLPPDLQKQVDAIFDDEALRPRELAAVRIRDHEGYDNAMRQQFEAHMNLLLGGPGAGATDPRLEAFFEIAALGESTLATLYKSIEYLKYFEGEKHLVLISEHGIYLPRAEDDEGLAATASNARVAVHTILTGGPPSFGGIDVSQGGYGVSSVGAMRMGAFDQAMAASGPLGAHSGLFAIGTMRTFATRSGGYFATSGRAQKAFDRIDAATRAQYVIGYYPAGGPWDGDYRAIDVTVNRPGVTVSSRRGYFATDELVPFDRRQFLTHSRITSALESVEALNDIRMTIAARVDGGDVIVEGTIDPSRLPMEPVDGIRSDEVDLAIFVGSRADDIVGEKWQKISIRLGEGRYQRAVDGGIPFTVRVPVKATPRYVKAIVYDYAADLVGTATARIR